MGGGNDKARKRTSDEAHAADEREDHGVPKQESRPDPDERETHEDAEVKRLLHDAFDEILDEDVPDRLKQIVARLAKPANGNGSGQG